MRLLSLVKLTLKWSLVIIALIILEPLVPFVILPLLGMYAFRLAVIILSKLLRPDLCRIISGFSACAASDSIYTRPNYTVLTFFFETRRILLEDYQKLILDKCVEARRANGKLKYPEMSQYVSYFLGFPFWRKDPEFHISNHIHLYQSPEVSESGDPPVFDETAVMKLSNELLVKPYQRKRSPWEMLVIPNARSHATGQFGTTNETEQTTIIFRFHHALADGFSSIRLLAGISKGRSFKVPKEWERGIPGWQRWLLTLFYPFLAIPIMLPVFYEYFDKNPWVLPTTNRHKRKTHFACSPPLPVSYIKDIKNALKVSFNGVVLAAISGGVRNYMTEKGLTIPKHIHMGMPMPVPGHPDKLTNHMTANFMKLPLGIRGTTQRLAVIEKEVRRARRSLVPSVAALYGPIWLGSAFQWLIRMLREGSAGTGTMSLFPGPGLFRAMSGEPIISLGFLMNRLHDHGVFLSGLSYADNYLIIFGGDHSIISSQEEAQKVVDKIMEEMKILKKESTNNSVAV